MKIQTLLTLYGSVQTCMPDRAILADRAKVDTQGTTVLHYQFEDELKHLEQIMSRLVRGSPLGMPYWRRRVMALAMHQRLVPDGASRVTRLLGLFDQIERGAV
jgi:hypothetical protein